MTLNPNSWNQVANVVFIDNPVGTGYSHGTDDTLDTNEDQVAAGVHTFINEFLEANPEFQGRDIYVTGESYAGHYIPAVAYEFVTKGSDIKGNFKGIAIGNGWVDPKVQYPQYAEFAHENKLVSDDEYETLKSEFKQC